MNGREREKPGSAGSGRILPSTEIGASGELRADLRRKIAACTQLGAQQLGFDGAVIVTPKPPSAGDVVKNRATRFWELRSERETGGIMAASFVLR
jgi:hypothetical protein